MALLRLRTGIFSAQTPEKCEHYAQFLQHLGRHQADAVFWCLFVFVLMLLIAASQTYIKSMDTFHEIQKDPEKASTHLEKFERRRQRCLIFSLVCCLLALPAVVLEAFAAFAVQFCDGEDLMMLYWGFWTLLQVGSLIAIFGIALNQWYGIANHKEPPWATALGTPVLVIAALGHGLKQLARRKRRISNSTSRKSLESGAVNASGTPSTSSTMTLGGAEHIGYTLDGQPLFVVLTTDSSAVVRDQ